MKKNLIQLIKLKFNKSSCHSNDNKLLTKLNISQLHNEYDDETKSLIIFQDLKKIIIK